MTAAKCGSKHGSDVVYHLVKMALVFLFILTLSEMSSAIITSREEFAGRHAETDWFRLDERERCPTGFMRDLKRNQTKGANQIIEFVKEGPGQLSLLINKTMNDPKFKDGLSCIDGAVPPTEISKGNKGYFCVIDFEVNKFQGIISKEFGSRCANGTCNFHNKIYYLVCGKNQATTFLLSPAILLLRLCSGLL